MKRIVLVRHGESQWNMENRFTGWTNVDLTEKGKEEAFAAGRLLKENGFHFDIAYTSYLKRAVKTLNNVLDAMDEDWIPVEKSWRLNEKHYGMLQGLNKAETAAKYGDEQVLLWRRSFDVAPPRVARRRHRQRTDGSALRPRAGGLSPDDREPEGRHRACDALLGVHDLPETQGGGLHHRGCPRQSLRGIVKHLKGISDSEITKLNIPTATPYVFEFDDKLQLVKDYYLGDADEIARKQQAVANQGKAK